MHAAKRRLQATFQFKGGKALPKSAGMPEPMSGPIPMTLIATDPRAVEAAAKRAARAREKRGLPPALGDAAALGGMAAHRKARETAKLNKIFDATMAEIDDKKGQLDALKGRYLASNGKDRAAGPDMPASIQLRNDIQRCLKDLDDPLTNTCERELKVLA